MKKQMENTKEEYKRKDPKDRSNGETKRRNRKENTKG